MDTGIHEFKEDDIGESTNTGDEEGVWFSVIPFGNF